MKKLIVVLMLIVLLAACVPTPTPTPTGPKTNRDYQGGKPFRVVLSSAAHPVHKTMLAGFLAACKDLDLLCEPITMGDVTIEEYLAKVETAVSLGSSAVIINLGAPVLYQPGKDLVAGVPAVVAVHSEIKTTEVPGLVGWIAADPSDYAKRAAKAMADKITCEGKVAVMQNAQSDLENLVGNTFGAELKRLCPAVTVLATQIEGVEPSKAAAVDAAVLAAHPDLTGALSTTGGGPTSWATALKEAGKKPGDVVVISMDYTIPNLDLVKAGWVYALLGQPIYEEFYKGVELALAKIKGEKVEYANPIPAPIVKAADLDFYYKQNSDAGIK